ncbi:MAG TPA: hypothetical protein VHM19_23325 [Polyangiales bacterium]|jgi:hypothetical protein|nr:hypothetical protein [Polyangiales bacterium]
MTAPNRQMLAELQAELDSNAAVYNRAAKMLRRGAEMVPYDAGEPLRELAAIYEHFIAMQANWRNKWLP